MPVYNTGEILRQTIDSILKQTYSDWELLLIDDGSTDKSGELCDEYAAYDNRIKVWHKQNGGICDARNFGLSKCSGEYIAFCDHDDLYTPKLLEVAYQSALKNKADLVKFRYKEISSTKEYTLKKISSKDIVIENFRDCLYTLNSIGYFVTVWSFLYRKEWLLGTGILFDTRQKHGGEDFDFNVKLIPYANRMVIIPDVLYLHFIRGSLSTSAKMYEDVMLHFLDTQKLINDVAISIEANITTQIYPFIKYYGQSIINFVSGAVKLHKTNQYIVEKLLDFSLCNIVKRNISLFLLIKSLLINPKETIFYILSYLKLNSIIVELYKFLKNER